MEYRLVRRAQRWLLLLVYRSLPLFSQASIWGQAGTGNDDKMRRLRILVANDDLAITKLVHDNLKTEAWNILAAMDCPKAPKTLKGNSLTG